MRANHSSVDALALADAQHQDGEIAMLRKQLNYLQAQVREQTVRLARFRPANNGGQIELLPEWGARLDSLERRMDILVEQTLALTKQVEDLLARVGGPVGAPGKASA